MFLYVSMLFGTSDPDISDKADEEDGMEGGECEGLILRLEQDRDSDRLAILVTGERGDWVHVWSRSRKSWKGDF